MYCRQSFVYVEATETRRLDRWALDSLDRWAHQLDPDWRWKRKTCAKKNVYRYQFSQPERARHFFLKCFAYRLGACAEIPVVCDKCGREGRYTFAHLVKDLDACAVTDWLRQSVTSECPARVPGPVAGALTA